MLTSVRDRCFSLASEELPIKKKLLFLQNLDKFDLKLYAVYKRNIHLDGRITGFTNPPIRPS